MNAELFNHNQLQLYQEFGPLHRVHRSRHNQAPDRSTPHDGLHIHPQIVQIKK
jgi:hypothetical protein